MDGAVEGVVEGGVGGVLGGAKAVVNEEGEEFGGFGVARNDIPKGLAREAGVNMKRCVQVALYKTYLNCTCTISKYINWLHDTYQSIVHITIHVYHCMTITT